MKKILLATVFALALTTPAFAEGYFVQGDVGAAIQPAATDLRDNSVVFGGTVGYDFNRFQVALAYAKVPGTIGNQIDADTVTAEVTASPFTFGRFTPFAGAGAGYTYLAGSAVRNNVGQRDVQEVPVFDAVVGVKYDLTTNFALVTTGKYLTSIDTVTTNNVGQAANYSTFTVTSGVRYTW